MKKQVKNQIWQMGIIIGSLFVSSAEETIALTGKLIVSITIEETIAVTCFHKCFSAFILNLSLSHFAYIGNSHHCIYNACAGKTGIKKPVHIVNIHVRLVPFRKLSTQEKTISIRRLQLPQFDFERSKMRLDVVFLSFSAAFFETDLPGTTEHIQSKASPKIWLNKSL